MAFMLITTKNVFRQEPLFQKCFWGRNLTIFPADVQSPNGVKPSGDMTLTTDRLGLTHWNRVTPIWVSKLTIIGLDNGLEPGRRQAIIWTNAGIMGQFDWPNRGE